MRVHLTQQRAALVLVLCLLLAACTDNALRNAAIGIKGAADTNKTLTQTTIEENSAGIISDDDTRMILGVTGKMADAVISAANITKQYTTFDPNQRPALSAVIDPVVKEVNAALASGLLGIKSPTTKKNVTDALTVIQTAVVAAQQALGGK